MSPAGAVALAGYDPPYPLSRGTALATPVKIFFLNFILVLGKCVRTSSAGAQLLVTSDDRRLAYG